MTERPINPQTYFSDIGAWPKRGAHAGAYVLGLAASLLLTFGAYVLATHHALTTPRVLVLLALALLQFAAQAVLFLHVSFARGARLRAAVLAWGFGIVLILAGGSVWIMQSLATRMQPDMQQVNSYLNDQDGGI